MLSSPHENFKYHWISTTHLNPVHKFLLLADHHVSCIMGNDLLQSYEYLYPPITKHLPSKEKKEKEEKRCTVFKIFVTCCLTKS